MAPQPDAQTSRIEAVYGTGTKLVLPESMPQAATARSIWLIDSTCFSPAWNQWILGVVSLAETPGFPPPVRHFQDATHEMLVLALNPEAGRYSQAILDTGEGYQMLLPLNYCDQFQANDGEMAALAAWMVWGVVNGHLQLEHNGDTDRTSWLTSAVKTLAHIRGEVHAR